MTREEYIQYLRLVVHTAKLDKLTADQLDEMRGTYSGAIERLVDGIFANADADPEDRGRALKLMRQFSTGLDAVTEKATGDIVDFTTQMGLFSFDELNDIVSWDGLVKDFNALTPTVEDVKHGVLTTKVAGNNINAWISNVFNDTEESIRQSLNAGRVAGNSYPDIAAAIRKDLKSNIYKMVNGKAVQMDPEHELETITRSYVQQANVNAQTSVYAANTDVVGGVKWVSTLENGSMSTGRGTCPRCAALDGQIFEMGPDGQPANGPRCTLHPRCRCVLVPQTKTWRELGFDVDEMEAVHRPWVERTEESIALGGRRDILDFGHTNKNYSELFKEKDPYFQDNLVGPRRAEMIRQDYFGLSDIIDKRGNLLPIERLRELYKIPGTGRGGIPTANIPTPPVPPPVVAPPPGTAPTVEMVEEVFKRLESSDEYTSMGRKLDELTGQTKPLWQSYKNDEIQYEEYSARRRQIDLEKRQLKSKRLKMETEDFLDHIRPPKGGKIDWTPERQGSRLISKNKATYDTIIKNAEDMLHPDVLDKIPQHRISVKTGDRAYHSGREIHLGGPSPVTFVHEFGHAVETYYPGVYDKALAFRNARTQGEKKTQITRGEWGYQDKFFRHYCGRVYSFRATEIVSMGLQNVFDDPVGFYKSDPEYFRIILEIMWGEI